MSERTPLHDVETWVPCSVLLPPERLAVDTKIDDADGVRNQQPLKFWRNLWWCEDMGMYVYYSPTHWRELGANSV